MKKDFNDLITLFILAVFALAVFAVMCLSVSGCSARACNRCKASGPGVFGSKITGKKKCCFIMNANPVKKK